MTKIFCNKCGEECIRLEHGTMYRKLEIKFDGVIFEDISHLCHNCKDEFIGIYNKWFRK